MERKSDHGLLKKVDGGSGRLRPVSDPLELVGFPSKGDKTYALWKLEKVCYWQDES
jgi:hypothetical protein